MLAKITTDGFTDKLFHSLSDARKWCIDYLTEHPDTLLPLEIMSNGEIKGWVLWENGKPVWQKNINNRYSEYYHLSLKNGSVRNVALDVLNGKQLYLACAPYPFLDESDARKITRKQTQYGIKNERNVGGIFQVIDMRNWTISRHGWTFAGVNRYTNPEYEIIIHVPSRRIVKWAY